MALVNLLLLLSLPPSSSSLLLLFTSYTYREVMGVVSRRFKVDVTMGVYTRLCDMLHHPQHQQGPLLPQPPPPCLQLSSQSEAKGTLTDPNYTPGEDKDPSYLLETAPPHTVLPHFLKQVGLYYYHKLILYI